MPGGLRLSGNSFSRRLDRAAALMPKHDDELRSKMLDCVLDAPDYLVIQDVARNSNYKKIAQSLIEDDLGRSARISTADDNGERVLAGSDFRSARGRLTRMLELARGESLVTGFQKREGIGGGDFLGVGMFWLFGQ